MSSIHKSHKGQGALEYLILFGIVAFVALVSFAPNGLLSRFSATSKVYSNSITRVLQGENPKPINGGWCAWAGAPLGMKEYRTCECPSPAFGGQPCIGINMRDGQGPSNGNSSGGPPINNSCGNGNVEVDQNEECDGVADCVGCRCANGKVSDGNGHCVDRPAACGDGKYTSGQEQCDGSSLDSPVPSHCTPTYGQTCNYCAGNCTIATLSGGRCGDGKQQGTEECDKSPYCADDSTCKCKSGFTPNGNGICVDNRLCGNHKIDPGENCTACVDDTCEGKWNEAGCGSNGCATNAYALSCSTCNKVRCVVDEVKCSPIPCGNGKMDVDEECDGTAFGSPYYSDCTPTYFPESPGDSCTHCSSDCKITEKFGLYCGDGIWDKTYEQCDGGRNCNVSCECDNFSVPNGKGACVSASAKCGDGHIDLGEECEKGTAHCTTCVCNDHYDPDETGQCNYVPYCGDNHVDPPNEECEGSTNCSNCKCIAHHKSDGNGNCVYVPYCGDNHVDPGEDCELGTANCLPTCKCDVHYKADGTGKCVYVPYCGDKVKNTPTEDCDGTLNCGVDCKCIIHYNTDGNGNCVYVNYCGDRIWKAPEECDGSAHCDANCKCQVHYQHDGQGTCWYVPYCGDGIWDPANNEECDNPLPGNYCTNCYCDRPNFVPNGHGHCIPRQPVCGDNYLDPGEECDEHVSGFCDNSCKCVYPYTPDGTGSCIYADPRCGDNVWNPAYGEECDFPNAPCGSDCKCDTGYLPDSNGGCNVNTVVCGDGDFDPGEECDKTPFCLPNCKCTTPGYSPDGSGNCRQWQCGDGEVQPGEQCETYQNGCSASCQCYPAHHPVSGYGCVADSCGNGFLDDPRFEECDSGIGCDSTCHCQRPPYVPSGNENCSFCGFNPWC